MWANRQTIIPCAKVLVVDNGNLIQQGSPLDLMQQEGKFQDLCKAAGEREYQYLLALASLEAEKLCLAPIY